VGHAAVDARVEEDWVSPSAVPPHTTAASGLVANDVLSWSLYDFFYRTIDFRQQR
jgi:hypothetical protein